MKEIETVLVISMAHSGCDHSTYGEYDKINFRMEMHRLSIDGLIAHAVAFSDKDRRASNTHLIFCGGNIPAAQIEDNMFFCGEEYHEIVLVSHPLGVESSDAQIMRDQIISGISSLVRENERKKNDERIAEQKKRIQQNEQEERQLLARLTEKYGPI